MLQTTCPPTCPLVQVLVHFVGPKLDVLDRQNSGQYKGRHGSHRFLSEVFELEIVIINAKIMYWTHFPDLFRVSVPLNVRHLGYKCQYFSRILRQNHWLNFNQNSHTSRENYCHQFVVFV